MSVTFSRIHHVTSSKDGERKKAMLGHALSLYNTVWDMEVAEITFTFPYTEMRTGHPNLEDSKASGSSQHFKWFYYQFMHQFRRSRRTNFKRWKTGKLLTSRC